MAYEIKARSISEILDGAFQIYRDHFAMFIAIAASVLVPAAIILSFTSWQITGSFEFRPQPGVNVDPVDFALMMLAMSIILGCAYLCQHAALTSAIADAYLGKALSYGAPFRRAVDVVGTALGACLLAYLGMAIGILLFIVPGIILGLAWTFALPAIVIEHCGPVESLRRSWRLTRGRRGRLFVLLLVVFVIQAAISWGAALSIPAAVSSIPVLGGILKQIPAILVAPLFPSVITVAYFDARVRDEAFDLEMLAQGIGGDAPQPTTVVAPPTV